MATEHDKEVLKQILNPLMPGSDLTEIEEDAPIEHSGYAEARKIEVEGVKKAEQEKNYEEAVQLFTTAIEVCPVAPSCYNNRAQAMQLMNRQDDAIKDLDEAIRLSEGKGRSACNAYTQRAMIQRLNGDNDAARADYDKAAKLGSNYARLQLAVLNPYAAMCNAALAKIKQDLREGKA